MAATKEDVTSKSSEPRSVTPIDRISSPLIFGLQPQTIQRIFNIDIDERLFINRELSVISLGWYFPTGEKWVQRYKNATLNVSNDLWAKKILSLKGCLDLESQEETISDLARRISGLLNGNIPLIVMAVPSSTMNKPDHGATKLTQAISNGQYVCGNRFLIRTETVVSSHAGNRSSKIHERTIAVSEPSKITGRTILLLDDVVTTGTIMRVCVNKLQAAGAAKIVCLTIGRTVSSDRWRHEDFPLQPLCELRAPEDRELQYNKELAQQWYREVRAPRP